MECSSAPPAAESCSGAGAAQLSAYTLRQHYDIGYTQCMVAKGDKVPQAAAQIERPPRYYRRRRVYLYAPPPPPVYYYGYRDRDDD